MPALPSRNHDLRSPVLVVGGSLLRQNDAWLTTYHVALESGADSLLASTSQVEED